MKKKQVLLAVFAATMLTPTVAWVQKTEQTVTAKTAMLLQFRRGKVNVFFLNYHLLR